MNIKYLLICMLLPTIGAAQSSTAKLELFCSSGGFLYNTLEITQLDSLIKFSGSGYDHGLNISKKDLTIDQDANISGFSFLLHLDQCDIDIKNEKLIQCLNSQEVEITFNLYDGAGVIKKKVAFADFVLSNKNFRIHTWLGVQIIGQELRQGCVDLTGL